MSDRDKKLTLHYLNSKFKAALFEVVSRSELLRATVEGLNRRFMGMTTLLERVSVSLKASVAAFAESFDASRGRIESAGERFSSIEGVFGEIYGIGHELADEAVKTGGYLHEIDDIVETLNILSLNASIQAARAGSAGKAFAVVAQEIRRHAANTKDTIDATSEGIDSLVTKIGELSSRMERVHGEVREGAQAMREAMEAIERQKAAMEDVRANLADIESDSSDYADIRQTLERMIAESAVSKDWIERILVAFQKDMAALKGV